MFSDGTARFYMVQHADRHGRWVASALDAFLFGDMSYEDKRGAKGDRYRKILEPQSTNSPLWQKFGIHGFTTKKDAEAVIRALRAEHPDRRFRIVYRTITQHTEEVSVYA